MREGVFLQPQFAISGLNENICDIIQSALMLPVENKKIFETGTNILSNLLEILMDKDGNIAEVSSLFHAASEEENRRIARGKKLYSAKQNIIIKSQRFYVRNKIQVLISSIVGFFVIFVTVSMIQGRNDRLTTAGMSPETVAYEYYEAFSSLNHLFMEACVRGADKSDINVAINFFAIIKLRESYEGQSRALITPARAWRERGGELPAPNVFGVTDLVIKQTGGNEFDNLVYLRADYILWYPHEEEPSRRTDDLKLEVYKGSWFITEINRTIH
jgi:hypothetical protein